MLNVQNLCFDRKKFSLKNISFTVEEGMIIGLVGRNGAGKTTLLRCLTNRLPISSGDYHIFGKRLYELDEEELSKIGYVDNQDEMYKTFDKIPKMKKYFKTKRNFDFERFLSLTKRLELSYEINTDKFSVGDYEKLLFAIELSHGTKMLFVDESTAMLDNVSRNNLFDLLREFTLSGGSVLLTSHIISDLEKVCDKIVYLEEGATKFEESTDSLKDTFAILTLTDEEFSALPSEAILWRDDERVLVKKQLVNPAFIVEETSLDELMTIFMEVGYEKIQR